MERGGIRERNLHHTARVGRKGGNAEGDTGEVRGSN